MDSRMFKKLDDLERSGKPLWKLRLPRVPKGVPRIERSIPNPDDPNLKGWISERRSYAYTYCCRYFEEVELGCLILGDLSMNHHPRWVQEGAAVLPAGEIPEIELAIVDIGIRILAENWNCQYAIRDEDQLHYFRTELPGFIFLTKLRLALDQIVQRLRLCIEMIDINTERIRRKVRHMYKEHKRCYENAEPRHYLGLASGKESPLRHAIEFDPKTEYPSETQPPEIVPSNNESGSAGESQNDSCSRIYWGGSEGWGDTDPESVFSPPSYAKDNSL
ncbi:hypothetical protein F5X99DRAFT_274557 [Biscogniauxia marginata]|nr:hypothetical protein F5X99DRAFT_274557 [Biscogniauxia marginata]